MTMKPPPPRFPACGYVTARAKAVATAASTALPPFLRISRPTSDPGAETDTTRPCVASSGLSVASAWLKVTGQYVQNTIGASISRARLATERQAQQGMAWDI